MTIYKIKGTKDYFFDEAYTKLWLQQQVIALAERYCFQYIETPIIEPQALFVRSLGVTSDIVHKELFSLVDRKDNLLTLKPDGTAGMVRALLNQGLISPGRFFYVDSMFRYERPQKGRLRQFTQAGFELLGDNTVSGEVTLLQLGHVYLQTIGLHSAKLTLNHLGTVLERSAYSNALKTYLLPHVDTLSPLSKQRLEKNPLRILDTKDEAEQTLLKDAPVITDFLGQETKIRFEKIKTYLTRLHIPYTVNYGLVRGLDYYSGLVFEWVISHQSEQNAVIAGGRYDEFFNILGKEAYPGIGFAIGIDRILSHIELRHPTGEKIAILPKTPANEEEALVYAEQVRNRHKQVCVMSEGSVKTRMKWLNRNQFTGVYFIDDGTVVYRDLHTGEEKEFSLYER